MGGALHYLGDYFWGFNYEIIFNIPHYDAESQCAQKKKTPSSRAAFQIVCMSSRLPLLLFKKIPYIYAHPPRR